MFMLNKLIKKLFTIMPNIIDSIQLSGVTYTLSAQTSGGEGTVNGHTVWTTPSGFEYQYVSKEPYTGSTSFRIEVLPRYSEDTFYDIRAIYFRNESDDQTSASYKSIYVDISNGSITSVTRADSGDYTWELSDGKLYVTFNEGYHLGRFFVGSFQLGMSLLINKIESGNTSDVLETGVYNTFDTITKYLHPYVVTGASSYASDGHLYFQTYSNIGYNDTSSLRLYNKVDMRYNSDEGLMQYFQNNTLTNEYLNTGTMNYCSVPNIYPNYGFAYTSMVVEFKRDYTGSDTTRTLRVGVINQADVTFYGDYYYNGETLSYAGENDVVDVVKDGYNYTLTPKGDYSACRIQFIEDNLCNISGIDKMNKSGYLITGVTIPTYYHKAQDVIDDIYDKLDDKQDTLIAGENITISGNVISSTASGGGGGMDEDMEKLISSALVDLNDRKIDASKAQRKGDYATKSELSAKANASEVMTLDKSKENELVTAQALNDLNNRFGGLSLVKLTQSEYDALATKDSNTLYIVTE